MDKSGQDFSTQGKILFIIENFISTQYFLFHVKIFILNGEFFFM